MAEFFLGITLPADFEEEVEDFRRRFAAPKTAPHITLIPPFNWPGTDLELEQIISASIQGTSPFVVKARGIGRFGRRVIYINVEPSEELLSLYEKLESGLENQDIAATDQDRSYHPHITLATRLSPGEFNLYMEELKDYNPSREFLCQQVALFKMEVRDRRRRWLIFKQVPLK
ncbi:MAG: 2'-5' RNA ligase family protein [Firmicutes bacterium]|jgi:2'-5' RNA ligase|nr:2'-5' RNA ligase family protein [Bacillota bacterium]